MRRFTNYIKENPMWTKVLLFSLTMFFLRIADGIIAFWSPNQIQNSLSSSILMGIVISFQSVVGFLADLIFPSLLRTARSRRLIYWGILMSAITSFLLLGSVYFPWVILFLVTMTFWGVYYELLGFAQYQFMGSVVPLHLRSSAWAVTDIFSNLAYFLGPLVATAALLRGYILTEGVFLAFLVTGLLMLVFSKNMHDAPTQVSITEVNPWVELKHWLSLTKAIWPAIIISFVLGCIDSTFWTTGAIWTEKLASVNYLGGLFLPLYQFPPIFLGLIVARLGIYKGKKILTEKFLIVAGFFLILLAVRSDVIWQLAMVFLGSVALGICYPFWEGVYTDLVARMGKERKDMIGLNSSIINLAYVVWPIAAGAISSVVGERLTFSYVGAGTVVVAIVLLFVTPKKLRLPQEEIKSWG